MRPTRLTTSKAKGQRGITLLEKNPPAVGGGVLSNDLPKEEKDEKTKNKLPG
jgi:hypothetical protein